MGIFFVSKQKCPAKQTGQSLKHSNQSKIQAKPHRSPEEGKWNTVLQREFSNIQLVFYVLDEEIINCHHKHKQQIPQRPEDE